MSKIQSKNTRPELLVRRFLHNQGFRYRIHAKLPGAPDIVLPKYKSVIFINGCFWHQHGCTISYMPKSNVEFWKDKLAKNKQRDQINLLRLKQSGWNVLVVWECELRNEAQNALSQLIVEL